MIQAKALALELAERLMGYCGPSGMLMAKVDARTGRVLDRLPLVEELGDYAQYVIELGLLCDNQELTGWGVGQVQHCLALAQRATGLIHARFLRCPWYVNHLYFSALHVCDTVWGLVEVLRLVHSPFIEEAAEAFFGGLEHYGSSEGLPVFGCVPLGSKALRIPVAGTMLTGYMAESLINLYAITGEESLLGQAEAMLRPWLTVPIFLERGLFRLRLFTSKRRSITAFLSKIFELRGKLDSELCVLVKGEAYLVFALLALYRVQAAPALKAAILHWRQAVVQSLRDESGCFFNTYNPRSGWRSGIALGTNHSVIEVLLDIYYDLGDEEALVAAIDCARAWLNRASSLGLVLERDGPPWALLDPQADFCVNLFKLWQVTGDSDWLVAGECLLHALIRYYHLPMGLAWSVNAHTGSVLQSAIETKFIGLFIKVLLVHERCSAGEPIFEDRGLRLLATDR